MPFNDLAAVETRARARPHGGADRRARDDQHRHGAAGTGFSRRLARSSRASTARCSSSTRRTRCRRRAAATRWRRSSIPTCGCAARPSPAACPARCSASRRRWKPACAACRQERAGGHSGMGTTLSANALALACLEASLDELMTPANYDAMHDLRHLSLGGPRARVRGRRTCRGTSRGSARGSSSVSRRPRRATARNPSARHGPSWNTPSTSIC